MSLSEPFIRRPIATALLAVGAFLAGLVAYFDLPVAPLPNTDLPIVWVSTTQPGADPQTMASTVTATLERHLGVIAGVNEMTSTSAQGRSTIVLQFDQSRRPADAARDVQAAINAAQVDLPSGLPAPPLFRKVNPNDRPVLILALTSPSMGAQALYDVADTILAQRLSQVPGVAQAEVLGAEKPAVRVQLDIDRLAAMAVGQDEARAAIAAATVLQPSGRIEGGNAGWNIRLDGQIDAAADYADLRLRLRDGRIVRLGDVAHVFPGVENDRQRGWLGSRPAVLVTVRKEAGANVIAVVDRVRAELAELDRWLPPSVDVTVINDQTGTIRASVDDVQLTLALAVALVVLIVGLFLRRISTSLAAAVAAPVSLAGAFAAMWALGYSLDNLSLMALTISVGFVVDDAIVMIENIVRHREMGASPVAAAIEGAREIGFTIVSMTISLIAVFIPLLFADGIQGSFLRVFAVTLTAAILVSAVVSLTVTPMACARLMAGPPPRLDEGWLARRIEAMADGYARLLRRTLARPRLMLALLALTCAGTVWLYGQVPAGGLPQQDTGLMRGFARASADASFQAMAERMAKAVAVIEADPAVASIGGVTGGSRFSSNTGQMFITLKPPAERKISAQAVIDRLRPQLRRIEGLNVFLQIEQDLRFGGRGSSGSFSVQLLSQSYDELIRWAPVLSRRMQDDPMFQDVNYDQEAGGRDARLIIDRDAAARLGVQPSDVNAALGASFAQRQIATIYGIGNYSRVVLEALPEQQRGPQDLARIRVRSADGALIPLSAVARIEYRAAPRSIYRAGQFSATGIDFNLPPDQPLTTAMQRIRDLAVEAGLPASVRVEEAGVGRLFARQGRSNLLLFAAALVAIYISLGVLYESWAQPLTILSTLPSAGLGALLALWALGFELSLIAVIGLILLMGIVKKNAILMVDFALAAERTQGLSPRAAIEAAARARFRPILMTTVTALLGALPLCIPLGVGAELRVPLGVVVVGGLLASQALTLFSTPPVYLALRGRAARRALRAAPQGA